MNSPLRPLLVALGGAVSFCLGILLRFQAGALGAEVVASVYSFNFSDMGARASKAAQANVLDSIGLTLLWIGGALIVLAAAVYLRPAWRAGGAAKLDGAPSLNS
jgi:hypothetical protein